ncbi:MAG: YceH family protein [Solirubrobacterales bacterium]
MEPDGVEIRVLGCLVEKQRTTPDAYPLSLNALRLACNQSTNREPVVDYDEQTVVEALHRLALRGWTRLASGAGSRARKYRHLLNDAFGLDDEEISLLAVLMLRGPQTPGELKQRGQRLHDFPDLAIVQSTLNRLIERGQVARHERQPGQKEDRYEQLLGGASGELTPPPADAVPGESASDEGTADDEPVLEIKPAEDRLTRLEHEVAELRAEIATLRTELGD